MTKKFDPSIGVVGLGYVGLPLAVAFAEHFSRVVGFDIHRDKVETILQKRDPNDEGLDEKLARTSLLATSEENDLTGLDMYVVGVPTPVDENHNPDLRPLNSACEVVGRHIKPGAVVVFESTVYPGVTEDICGPLIAKVSGLKQGKDFRLGYSPERMNPGDREHSVDKIIKVVSGEDEATLEKVSSLYDRIVTAGVFKARSIKVAEAAKVIENTQRDLNIALMNELAIIFDRIGIATADVLEAAGTKWNFIRMSPGLVGGHCIGVDPYYLTTKAEQLGYHPQVILAGRRINDGMGIYIAQRMVKSMVVSGLQPRGARVGVLGLTFKENVSDIRNSRVPDIIRELKAFGVEPLVHDPLADADSTRQEYDISLSRFEDLNQLDGLVLAVGHKFYAEQKIVDLAKRLKPGGVFVDVKSLFVKAPKPSGLNYWSL